MGGDKRVGDLNGDVKQFLQFHGFFVEALLKGLAFQLLHDDERMAVVILDVMNDADVGVIQLRGGAGFALETLQSLVVFDEGVRKELEGNAAAEAGVFGLVNDSHTAAPQLAYDAVVGDSLANHKAAPPVFGVMLGRTAKEVNRRAGVN
jgi:hypothetical protein